MGSKIIYKFKLLLWKPLFTARIVDVIPWKGIMKEFMCGDKTVQYLNYGSGYTNLYMQ